MIKKSILFFIPFVIFASCKSKSGTAGAGKDYKAMDPSMLDSTVKAGDDFFQFVNAKWMMANPIPPDKSSYGAFHVLDENSLNTLHKVMEDAVKADAAKGTNQQKVGDFWYSGMDTVSIEREGMNPIKPLLDQIAAMQTPDDIMKMAAKMHRYYNGVLFANFVSQDAMNSTDQILEIWQGGIGLPDRDYYFRTDARSEQIRKDYVAHIKNVFVLTGADEANANAHANTIMKIETQLAQASMDNVSMRDPYKVYHKMTLDELKSTASNINWNLYFTELKTPVFNSLNIAQPEFIKTVNDMLKSVPINDWKTYLSFHLVDGLSPYLSNNFIQENFDFYSKKLQGVEVNKTRWKRITETADFCLGEALGQEYVKVTFSEESKQKMIAMVNDLKVSLGERINQLDWMSDSTKQLAQKKLSTFTVKIGYPDKWRDYTALEIDRGSYVLNVLRSIEFEAQRNYNKIGQPVDKSEWGMKPQTVNAYYNPSNNEIVFPAAILQPPFFDPLADDAINYGAIGAVIGHEITHGFDDQGRQFDADGNLKLWWTADDDKKFTERAGIVITQFDSYCPFDSLCINGNLTLGENIADFGGLTVAYNAYKRTEEYNANKAIDGFTPAQRFFIGFARIWAGNYRDEAMRTQLLTNVHSPGKWRVNGTVINMPEWYAAFGIKEGDKMYLPENTRARIW